jgi:hypothetical protein
MVRKPSFQQNSSQEVDLPAGIDRRSDGSYNLGYPSPVWGGEVLQEMPIDEETKQRIDRWIKENGRNSYGDPPDTVYAGGNPLFDERTGRTKDRYEYILEKHPELRNS